jgi:hypothetical protein
VLSAAVIASCAGSAQPPAPGEQVAGPKVPAPPADSAQLILHVDAGIVSAGCVVVGRETVIALLRRLDPAARPVIHQRPMSALAA